MTDMQPAEAKSDPRRWTGTASVSAVIAIILAVLFVFPGFVAAGFSKAGVSFMVVNGTWSIYHLNFAGSPPGLSAEDQIARVALCPAYQLMWHSSLAGKFYTWEFRLAGGRAFEMML